MRNFRSRVVTYIIDLLTSAYSGPVTRVQTCKKKKLSSFHFSNFLFELFYMLLKVVQLYFIRLNLNKANNTLI